MLKTTSNGPKACQGNHAFGYLIIVTISIGHVLVIVQIDLSIELDRNQNDRHLTNRTVGIVLLHHEHGMMVARAGLVDDILR